MRKWHAANANHKIVKFSQQQRKLCGYERRVSSVRLLRGENPKRENPERLAIIIIRAALQYNQRERGRGGEIGKGLPEGSHPHQVLSGLGKYH